MCLSPMNVLAQLCKLDYSVTEVEIDWKQTKYVDKN